MTALKRPLALVALLLLLAALAAAFIAQAAREPGLLGGDRADAVQLAAKATPAKRLRR